MLLDRPRLPPEILWQIVQELERPCSLGDPNAHQTLSSLSLVSKTFRHWALAAKYSVVVAPRHVRDFRKWHVKVKDEMIGYNQALFVALDDVSKLTSTSAGWEADLQRFLQRLGPNLTHLSLWTSETRAVLRDPAQIRGPRFRNRMPIHTMNDVVSNTIRRRLKLERRLKKMKSGAWSDPNTLKPLKIEKDRDERQTRAEIAAARERARQKIPNWLKYELETKEEEEVKKTYQAHLGTTVREYQHELDVQANIAGSENGREGSVMRQQERMEILPDQSSSHSSLSSESEAEAEAAEKDSVLSSDSDDDLDIDWGCMPIKLSICPALPLHEHENALNFARMTIWTRVEELDVFISVPAEVGRYLELFSSLVASPIRKFRISSIYASLLITTTSISNSNISRGLEQIRKSEVLSSLLLDEFYNKHLDDVGMLENALLYTIATAAISPSSTCKAEEIPFDEKLRTRGGLHTSLKRMSIKDDGNVKVTILQTNQSHWGKLKDRKQDFWNCSLRLTTDCWDTLMK